MAPSPSSSQPTPQADQGCEPDLTARVQFRDIVEILRKPGGSARLTIDQRRFMLAALIGSMVPADGKIRPVELEKLRDILMGKFIPGGKPLDQALDMARSGLGDIAQFTTAASRLQELFSIEDRCNLVGFLWDVALSDRELHTNEEKLIYEIADQAGVPRKKVIEQQARASARTT
jgi:uncharacterized tellurite resistance protein B-like protein